MATIEVGAWIHDKESLEVFLKKNTTATPQTSKEIAQTWSDAAKAKAFFSARVTSNDVLEEMRKAITWVVEGRATEGQAKAWIRDFFDTKGGSALQEMGYLPSNETKKEGGNKITQLASATRIALIVDQNVRMSTAAKQWHDFQRNAWYEYVMYHTKEDGRVRNSHKILDRRIWRKGDPAVKRVWPPQDFRCRCWMEPMWEEDLPEGSKITDGLPDGWQPADSGYTFDPEEWPFNLPPLKPGTPPDTAIEIKKEVEKAIIDKVLPPTIKPPVLPPIVDVTKPVPIVQPTSQPIKIVNPNNSMQVEPVVPLVFKLEAMQAPVKPQSNEEVKLRQKAEKHIIELDRLKTELDKKSEEIEKEITRLKAKLDPVTVSKNPDPLAILFKEESENDRMISEKIQNLQIDFILARKDYEKQTEPIERAAIKTANKLGDLILSEMMSESTAKFNYPRDFNGNPIVYYKKDRKPEDAMKCKFSADVGIKSAIQILDTVKETAIESTKHGLPPLRGIKTHHKSGIAGDMGDGIMAVNGDVMSRYVKSDPKYSPIEWNGVDKTFVSTDYFNGPDKIKNIIWHEYGHHFHQSASVNHTGDYFERVKPMEKEIYALFNKSEQGAKSSTEYAMKNAMEWFAENYAMAKMNRWDLVDEYLFLKLSEMML